ncbi:MAG: xylulokinase, partial [Treponemataceae bacterium]
MSDVIKKAITEGKTTLGIELGSTRIKAVLVDELYKPIASGSYEWESQLIDGNWTYSLDVIQKGIQASYANLYSDVKTKYGIAFTKTGAIGISAMMHGYMAFDREGNLLVPFRTWRNTTTAQSAEELTTLLSFNIPHRWSIAHLYQAILNSEKHVGEISYLTTLAGYIHWMLTGEKVLGVGDASGMFPIDSTSGDYAKDMIDRFDNHIKAKQFAWKTTDILPKVLSAGDTAGSLTSDGVKFLDPTGTLQVGIPLCPPEGDAGTGMVATNAVASRTGNVSAGTSIFAMIVLEKSLSKVYPEIDMVTTPDGKPVAMVHCNNCTSDLDAWVKLFCEYTALLGVDLPKSKIYDILYEKALEADTDCGGLISFNYFGGEPITDIHEGRPLFVRNPDSIFNLANFMRTHLYGALATLKIGMDILFEKEKVQLEQIV